MLKNIYLGFKFSFSYFSILPIHFHQKDDLSKAEVLNVMLLTLPLVGYLLGLLTITLYLSIEHLEWFGAIVSAIVYMVLYGFIHTEAIIDVFDAIYAKHSGKDAYQVIKEPTVGAIGVLYGVSFLLLKIAGIVMLFTHNLLAEFLMIILISRLSLLTLIVLHDFKSSFLTQLKEALHAGALFLLFIAICVMGSYLSHFFIVYLISGIVLGFLISLFLGKKLGFINGDVLGTTLESLEILLILGVTLTL